MARVEFTKDSISPTLKRVMPVLSRNIYQVLRYHEPNLAAEAKTNAKWTDRTGNARSGLGTSVQVVGRHQYALVLYGSVKYQIWLEVRFAGKYAIIMRTLVQYRPKVYASLYKLLERMGVSEG